jgi:hypothetical protein
VLRFLPLIAIAACQGADAPTDTAADVPRGAISFAFPLVERELFVELVGVDDDPVVQEDSLSGRVLCTDYAGRGFPHCYDEHDGSDYLLEGGFDTMDAGSATVIAGADGVVTDTDDGHYDRCHVDLASGGVSCDGHAPLANYVIVEHEGGVFSWYWHLMNGSVLVQPGDAVTCGQPLGRVGSSGNSSGPHLHFEVLDALGEVVDPYAGTHSQPETWWSDQREMDQLPGEGCGAR